MMEIKSAHPSTLHLRSKGLAVLAVCLLAGPLLVAEAAGAGTEADAPEEAGAFRGEAERRIRAFRAKALSRHLDLEEEQARALNEIMTGYDQRRHEKRLDLMENMRILRATARGSTYDEDAVAKAVHGVLEARAKLERIRQEEVTELLAELDPARQARLLVFFAEFQRDVARMMRGDGPTGPHGRPGPRGADRGAAWR